MSSCGFARDATGAHDQEIDELRAACVVFDATWYAKRYATVLGDEKDPVAHFVRIGAAAGLRPSPLFDTAWYVAAYPQVRRSGLNPLLHFLRHGKSERLKPNRLFDTGWYLATYRSAAGGVLDPLSHFLSMGPAFRPHVLFDPAFYAAVVPDVAASGENALVHFLERGAAEGNPPNPFFDTRWYLQQYLDARLSRLDPLSHFLEIGAARDYRPNPMFDTAWYRATYLSSTDPDANPLVHFIEVGASLETQPNPLFDFSAYASASELETDTRASLHRNYLADGSNLCRPASSSRQGSLPRTKGIRLLFVDATYPYPDRDSGSVDTYNHLKILGQLGLELTFVATAEFFATGARTALYDLGVDCVDTYKFSSVESFIESCGSHFDIFVLSRVYAGGHFYELARSVAPHATVVFNPVDLHHLRERREADLGVRGHGDATDWTEDRELYLARRCDMTLVVSSAEADLLRSATRGAKVTLMPLLREIKGRAAGFEERRSIGFVGNFGHRPNLDALQFFLDTIWPLLLEAAPDLQFEVVGAGMPDWLRCRRDRNVLFSGHVEHLEAVLSRWRLTVAPLRYGAGAKGKIVSSLAHGVPCVTTTIAVEGMGLTAEQVSIADDPGAFASAVLALYRDEAAWLAASDAGLLAVSEQNDIRRGATRWSDLFARAGVDPFSRMVQAA